MHKQTEFSHLREQLGMSIEDLVPRLGFSLRTLYRWENGDSEPRRAAIEILDQMLAARKVTPIRPAAFDFIDLFAGIGGLRRGFDAIGGKCLFTSEWDRYAQQTYLANYHDEPSHIMAGDITKISAEEIPAHDVLVAGFPCQPFSIAGVSKKNSLGRDHGFRCKAQGTLFFHVARIIEHHKPRAFLLENVKNLVNHDKGQTFKVILDTLKEELGYHVHWKVIDAKSFVPQHRERIFIVGFREPCDFTFDDLVLPDPLKGPRLKTILHGADGFEETASHYTSGKNGAAAKKYTLTDHLWQYLQDYAEKHRLKGNGFGFGLCGPDDVSRTLSARYYKDGSEILIKQKGANPRRLTPRECARLMGFDRPGQPEFKIPVSDMQAYKQFGNAVAVPAVEAVVRHLAPWILTGEDALPYAQKELLTVYG